MAHDVTIAGATYSAVPAVKLTSSGGEVIYLDQADFLQLAGGTMTGPLVLSGDPTANLGAATKQYADTHLNRTTAVNAADTNYVSLMARGIGLVSADTTPTVNGAINFTYG